MLTDTLSLIKLYLNILPQQITIFVKMISHNTVVHLRNTVFISMVEHAVNHSQMFLMLCDRLMQKKIALYGIFSYNTFRKHTRGYNKQRLFS